MLKHSSYLQGEFNKNLIAGKGRMVSPDLSWYEGEFDCGSRHGTGTFSIGYSASLYHGEWRAGAKHGKGSLQFSMDESYDGSWNNDYFHGNGKRRYADGSYYYGNWVQGKRNGRGIMIWTNSDVGFLIFRFKFGTSLRIFNYL